MSAFDPSAPGLPIVGGGGASLPDTPAAVLLDAANAGKIVGLAQGTGEGTSFDPNVVVEAGVGLAAGTTAGATLVGDGTDGAVLTSATISALLATTTLPAAQSVLGIPAVTSGVDTSRPAASTGLIGSAYVATDTGVTYDCESDGAGGALWRVRSSGMLDNTRIAVTNVSMQLVGTTTRAAPTTGTVVLFFGGTSLPGTVVQLAGNFSGGWMLGIGNNSGDRGIVSIYRDGVSPAWSDLTGATITGSLNALHAIAVSMTASTLRWSFDGGAVQSSALTGTPSGSGVYFVGGNGTPYTSGLYTALRVLSAAASDADLILLTNATARAARRIPAVASAPTILVDWHASRAAPGMSSPIAGTQPDRLYAASAVPRVSSW